MAEEILFGFETFPRLETERLVLRAVTADDAQHIFEFRSDYEVQKYNGPVQKRVSDAYSLILSLQKEFRLQEGITWGVAIKAHDELIGLFGLHQWNQYHRRAELGLDLNRAYWGQGIATEALSAILAFGFTRLNLNHIFASTIVSNKRSVQLLERLGFHRDGTRRSFSYEDDGTFHDSALYSLLQSEFDR